MHKVSIKNETENSVFPTYISIDGQPIRAVSVVFSQSVDEVPTCEIETYALPDIEALADVQFRFTPQTTQDAIKVLRHELMADKDLYNALVSSISSALKELPRESDICDAAKAIADRIVGAGSDIK